MTTSPDNVARTAELGWKLQGIKSRRGKTAREIHPGDRLVYYVSKAAAFAAVVEVTSEHFEDHDPIWTSKPGEDYPWRFEIRADVAIDDPARWVPAEDLREQLEFPRKWPAEHWKLAFQGNIRAWPEHDLQIVREALAGAATPSG
ncbi:MAG: EVE domain-containing protein [Actinomycetota bacterium]|nr:EVE domain-containing protein [Actinomycetota bacterium]